MKKVDSSNNSINRALPMVIDKTDKEAVWEANDDKISECMMKYLGTFGTLPTKSFIVHETGLCRETVYKHIRAGINPDAIEDAKMLTPQVIATVTRNALQGDLAGCKLHLQLVGLLEPKGGKQTNPQNNFLQINNTVINQQLIQQLTPEQLRRIEEIIAAGAGKDVGERAGNKKR